MAHKQVVTASSWNCGFDHTGPELRIKQNEYYWVGLFKQKLPAGGPWVYFNKQKDFVWPPYAFVF